MSLSLKWVDVSDVGRAATRLPSLPACLFSLSYVASVMAMMVLRQQVYLGLDCSGLREAGNVSALYRRIAISMMSIVTMNLIPKPQFPALSLF